MERKDSDDRDQGKITINHFQLKKEFEEDDHFINDHCEAQCEVLVSQLSDLAAECLVDPENSGGETREEPEKMRPRCGSCLLFSVKCLDLLINIHIIGLNYLNFAIRNI